MAQKRKRIINKDVSERMEEVKEAFPRLSRETIKAFNEIFSLDTGNHGPTSRKIIAQPLVFNGKSINDMSQDEIRAEIIRRSEAKAPKPISMPSLAHEELKASIDLADLAVQRALDLKNNSDGFSTEDNILDRLVGRALAERRLEVEKEPVLKSTLTTTLSKPISEMTPKEALAEIKRRQNFAKKVTTKSKNAKRK